MQLMPLEIAALLRAHGNAGGLLLSLSKEARPKVMSFAKGCGSNEIMAVPGVPGFHAVICPRYMDNQDSAVFFDGNGDMMIWDDSLGPVLINFAKYVKSRARKRFFNRTLGAVTGIIGTFVVGGLVMSLASKIDIIQFAASHPKIALSLLAVVGIAYAMPWLATYYKDGALLKTDAAYKDAVELEQLAGTFRT